MQLTFEIDGQPAEFRHSPMTGRADLSFRNQVIPIQSPYRPSAQFELRTRRVWRRAVGGRDVEIVKVRPRTFGGLRANTYTISVDGTVVAEATGS